MSMIGTFLVRSGILTSVHAFAVDPARGAFILALLAIYIGGALALFALRAGTVREGERFSPLSREGALVVNNVSLSAILGIVLLGTLYPLVTEAFGVRVSVGPPYFNPVSAIFVAADAGGAGGRAAAALAARSAWRGSRAPALAVAAVGAGRAARSLWLACRDRLAAVARPGAGRGVAVASFAAVARALAAAHCRCSYGAWCIAHLRHRRRAVGMAVDSAFTVETLIAAHVGQTIEVGPWNVRLDGVEPVAGPNWTALEARLGASYGGGAAHDADAAGAHCSGRRRRRPANPRC